MAARLYPYLNNEYKNQKYCIITILLIKVEVRFIDDFYGIFHHKIHHSAGDRVIRKLFCGLNSSKIQPKETCYIFKRRNETMGNGEKI